jgi:uncharacterized protein (UPF0276 family)
MRRVKPLVAGTGLGWRPETALLCERRPLAFVEVIAESVPLDRALPRALEQLVERGAPVVVHGVSLSLGSADPPDPARLERLRRAAARLNAPLVSEHVAFVRGGGHETDHLLPVPRTREALAIVIDNVRWAQDALDRPLVLENIACLFEWPDDAIREGELLAELCERTGAQLLLDVSNLCANALNFGWDVGAFLDAIESTPIAYAHVAGGAWRGSFFHDTHADPIADSSLALLGRVIARRGPLPVLLERDDGFGTRAALEAELDAIDALLRRKVQVAHVG